MMLLLAVAVGHLCVTISVMNWSQGHGINLKWMDNLILGVLALVGAVFLAGVWQVWGKPFGEWPALIQGYSFLCLSVLFVILPATTVIRHFRRPPEHARLISCETHDLAKHFGLNAVAGSGGARKLLAIPGNQSLRLNVREWDLDIDHLPASLSGLRILHLTDLHFAPTYDRRFFAVVVRRAMDAAPEPDFVFITGDFLDDDDTLAWIEPVLGPLKARYGKIAILGNHDYRHDFRGLRRELRTAGFTTLEGRWTTVDTEGGTIVIGGTSYPWGRDLDPARMPSGDLRILLSHAPDQVFRAAKWGMDLMLCGHNHGGQVRLPILGPILMPSRYGRRFDRGFYHIGETMMFVGQGVGGKHPLRFGCPPEVTHLRLRSSARPVEITPASTEAFANS